jgi:hypothetical protein
MASPRQFEKVDRFVSFVEARRCLQEAIISKVSQLERKNFPASLLKKTNRLGFHRINLCMEPAWSDHSENVGLTALVTRSLITTPLQAARVSKRMLKIKVPLNVNCGATWRRLASLRAEVSHTSQLRTRRNHTWVAIGRNDSADGNVESLPSLGQALQINVKRRQ